MPPLFAFVGRRLDVMPTATAGYRIWVDGLEPDRVPTGGTGSLQIELSSSSASRGALMKIRARAVIDGTGTAATPMTNVALAKEIHRTLGRTLGWSAEVLQECCEIHEAMLPRCLVGVHVPNRDMNGHLIPVQQIVSALRRGITRITGGQTTYKGSGDYVTASGVSLDEDTSVIETFLPRTITNRLRRRLIRLFVEFGRIAHQEVVLVAVGPSGYWIPTARLLNVRHDGGGLLRAG